MKGFNRWAPALAPLITAAYALARLPAPSEGDVEAIAAFLAVVGAVAAHGYGLVRKMIAARRKRAAGK